ncbi:hypothetical protein [Novosphingobium sp.]|uniref:hypothetical protein n=1 Tax=Novosphingobium sp. TaxID=1874826 RepID=UPI0035ADD2AD
MGKTRRTFTQEECKAFVDAANPHQWILVADNLHEQACHLWSTRGRGNITLIDKDGKRTTWDSTNRAVFLLAAFAMENMLKAFLVYETPRYISDGYLKEITTHELPDLARTSSLIPYRDRDMWVFEALSKGNESWARYPCGRNAGDVQPEQAWSPALWIKYCDMMRAYAKKMQKLLAKGWVGPYGYYGRWTTD